MRNPRGDPESQLPPSPDQQQQPLTKHISTLPNWLYILSFAPPLPSLIRQPRQFLLHPYVLYSMGTIAACIAGVGLPGFDIIFGYWTNGVASFDPSIISSRGSTAGIIATCVGIVYIVSIGMFLFTFTLAGVKLSTLLREQYLASILSQDQAFFDRVGAGEIITRASRDIDSVRTGLGERLGYLLWAFASIITAFVSAFDHSPRLAGVLFALLPLTFGLFTLLGYWSDNVSRQTTELDGKTSSFIEQILSSVRVVQSFDMSTKLIARLEYGFLGPLRKLARRRSWVRAVEQGSTFGAACLVYSMCFWYGGIEVARGQTVGDILVTFYNYVNLFFSLATIMPHFLATSQAIQSLANLRLQIERTPVIDIRDTDGITLASRDYSPSFELENVTFAYPSRPSSKVLDGVSLKINPGEFTAFVGPSGSGKSTLGALLLRLYDSDSGAKNTDVDKAILKAFSADESKKEKKAGAEEMKQLDEAITGGGVVRFAEHDVKNLNLKWLRSQVSVVLQNPQLFSGTVFENVAVGLTGTDLEYRLGIDNAADPSPSVKKRLGTISERVEEALHLAEAWDFVEELPDGLQTKITGGRTGVLSGGQVQRLAIARALVRRPKCLFLDEATSAVSADTELAIQENLYREQKKRGMTMVVIAHRLSTITNADKIVVMVDGKVRISGTYDQLMDEKCEDQTFRSMALATTVKRDQGASSEDDESVTEVGTGVEEERDGISPDADVDRAIPQPMRKVSEAFLNVKGLLIFGCFLGMAAGGVFVLAAWLHGRGVGALSIPDIPLMRSSANRWSLWFLVLAIGAAIGTILHAFALEFAGENMVNSLKRESVRTLVRQEVGFFESTSSGLGSLTASATSHPAKVGAVIGIILGQAIMGMCNLTGTIILSFILNWRLAVMVLPGLALAVIFGYTNHIYLERFEEDIVGDTEKQADFVGETANSITTIAALTREEETLRLFRTGFTSTSVQTSKRVLAIASWSMGVTQGVIYMFGALMFWWGARQVSEGQVSIADLFSVFEAVIICVYVSAKILTYSGDFTRMRSSLRTIQSWIDRKPQYATVGPKSNSEITDKFEGIEFRDVQLRYPARPDTLSLNSLSLRMESGKSYAFCGTSGAGKSSILAVLQRFYDITSGSILLDGVDIRNMPIEKLRAEMGYVSQEPVLFEGTIRWNLLMGMIDPANASQADVEWALDQACMLDFVKSLPHRLDTDLGMKGGRLSGGQRQRLCIARALLRKPRILLLDEATSALDGQSEAKVQQAIENASAGRITVIIAHRLSTIRKADVINVMEHGRLVESGSHEELLERKGRYFELVQAQL